MRSLQNGRQSAPAIQFLLQAIECARQQPTDGCEADARRSANLLVRQSLRAKRDEQPIPGRKRPNRVQDSLSLVEAVRLLRGAPRVAFSNPRKPAAECPLPVATGVGGDGVQPAARIGQRSMGPKLLE